MRRKLLIFLLTALFCIDNVFVIAQETAKNTQEKQLEEKAFALFRGEKFSEALPLMSQLLSMFPKEPEYNYGYAACLIETNQETEKAVKYLQYAGSKSSNPRIKYYMGRAFHLNYKFDEAVNYYKAFSQNGTATDKKKYQIDNLIAMCNNGKDLIRYISDLTVVDNKKIKSENFFYSYELKEFGGKLIMKPPEFKSKIDKKLEPVNTVVFLPNKSDTIYYGSYGEKAGGGRDIYRISKDMYGKWKKPEMLSPEINTPFDEDFPFMMENGRTLFFASKGHNSMGGYDIFRTEFDTSSKKWSKPLNLDFPINTPYDDYLFITDKNELYAFFTSNRETNEDKISVYNIVIDKSPVKREFNNIEEIINTSKLEVSSLAEIKRVEESRKGASDKATAMNQSGISTQTNRATFSNKFVLLTSRPDLTQQQISSEISNDFETINTQAEEINKQSNIALLIANEKNENANKNRKIAASYTEELKTINDNSLADEKRQLIYDLISAAEKEEVEAVTAFTLSQNLSQIATEMEKDAQKTKNLLTAVNSTANTNTENLVEIVNKNREKLNSSHNNYLSVETEIENRNSNAAAKQSEFKNTEKEYLALQNDIAGFEDEIKTIKQKIDAGKNDEEKSQLTAEFETKKADLSKLQSKESVLEEKYEKLKTQTQSSDAEINLLNTVKATAKTDTRTSEQLSKQTSSIDKQQLKKEIFEKELIADVHSVYSDKNEARNLKIDNTETVTVLLDTIHTSSTSVTETSVYKSSTYFPFSGDGGNQNSKLVSYQKEILNSQYHDNLAKEQEKQLNVLNTSLQNTSDKSTGTTIENQINDLKKEIDKNKNIAAKSNDEAKRLKPEALSEVDATVLTNEQLMLNASKYKAVNEFRFSDEQKKTLNGIKENKNIADAFQKNFGVVTKEIRDFETRLANADAKSKKELTKEIENKKSKQKEILKNYQDITKSSNSSEFSVYKDFTDKNRDIDVTNPNLRLANMLEKESEIYFEKASNLRKDAELTSDAEQINNEFVKADNLEKIAIQKQKYALDLYISNKAFTASANTSETRINSTSGALKNQAKLIMTADTNIVRKTAEITLNADEEQHLKTYRTETHKAVVMINEAKKSLSEAEESRNKAEAAYSATQKKELLKGVDAKEQKALDMMLKAYTDYGKADSLKYIVYHNQIKQLQQTTPDVGNNKIIARQYNQEAEFYFSEALKVRANSAGISDKKEKSKELARATELEKKALTSQELAVDILTDVDPVFFVSSGDLTKVDRLDVLNQPVDVSEIIKIKTSRIISRINPTEEELKKLDEAEKRRTISTQLIKDAENYKNSIDSLKNIIAGTTSSKEKNKANKQIPKLEKKMFASQFTAAEVNENINFIRYTLYKDYIVKNRLEGNSLEARQGKQLEKDANAKFIKARNLREKGFMKEDAIQAYELLKLAEKLEVEAIEDQERAYGVYLSLKPLEDEIKEYAELHKKPANNESNLVIKSSADLTHIETTESVEDTAEYATIPIDSADTKTIGEVLAIRTTNLNNDTTTDNTNINETRTVATDTTSAVRPDTSSVTADTKSVTADTTSETNNITVYTDTKTAITPDTSTTTIVHTDTKSYSDNTNTTENTNTETTNLNNTDATADNTNVRTDPANTNTPAINEALGKAGFGYTMLPVNAYSTANPIPMNVPLPEGVVFRVQIGAFKAPVKNEAFKGLSPVNGETLAGSAFVRYYVGMFYSEEAANIVRNQIKPYGYHDAFIVAYYNGKRISLLEARRLLKETSSPDYYNILAQAEIEKMKSRVTGSPGDTKTTSATADKTAKSSQIIETTNVSQITDLFYTVQIGVYKNPVTKSDLKNLSPVYQDNAYGFIRYTTGKFSDSKKAEIEKNRIVQLGISDAFVSAYYKGKKITLTEAAAISKQGQVVTTEEGVTYPEHKTPDTKSLPSMNKDDIYFKVQIATFKEKVPIEKVNEFLQIAANHGLDQEKDNSGATTYSIGKFKSYDQALQTRDMLINEGIKDAFITAFCGTQKIQVNEAKSLLNQ